MAAAQAADGEAAAFEQAMRLQGFNRVMGAAGIETATRPQQRAQEPLIETDQDDERLGHRVAIRVHSRSICALSCSGDALFTAVFAVTTMSQAGSSA